MMRACSTAEAADVLGLPIKQIDRWIKGGIVKPLWAARGRGQNHVFGMLDLLAIAVARDLRRRGFNLAGATAVCGWLKGHEMKELQEQWSRGRQLMLVAGDRVFPRLLTRAEMLDERSADVLNAHVSGGPVAIINLADCYERIDARLDELKRKASDASEPAKVE